ncbi:hypothetical protein P3S68_023892 [Capsicum galapagoense]
MSCSSKRFLFVCLSLAIFSIIISSQLAAFPVPETPVNVVSKGLVDGVVDGVHAVHHGLEAGHLGEEAADLAKGNMAKENIVTIAVTLVSLVISCLAFADILLPNY